MTRRQIAMIIMVLTAFAILPGSGLAQVDMNLMIAVKQGTGHNVLTMTGGNHFVSFGYYDLQTSAATAETNWGQLGFEVMPFGPSTVYAFGDAFSSDSGFDTFSESGGYSTSDTGVVDLNLGTTPQTNQGKGYLSANNQYMAIRHATTWTTPPEEIMLKVGLAIKNEGPVAATDLNGIFSLREMALFDMGLPGQEACVKWGRVTFSSPTYSISYDSTCSDRSTMTGADSGTFVKNTNGGFTLTPTGSTDIISGWLSANKEILVLSFGNQNNDGRAHNGMAVGLREVTGVYSDADLIGTYHVTDLHLYDLEAAAAVNRDGTVTWGTITFDGAGGFTFSVNGFDADGTSSTTTGSGIYSVDRDGKIQFDVTEEDGQPSSASFSGHLSSDGELLVMTRAQVSAAPQPSDGGGGGGGCFIQISRY